MANSLFLLIVLSYSTVAWHCRRLKETCDCRSPAEQLLSKDVKHLLVKCGHPLDQASAQGVFVQAIGSRIILEKVWMLAELSPARVGARLAIGRT